MDRAQARQPATRMMGYDRVMDTSTRAGPQGRAVWSPLEKHIADLLHSITRMSIYISEIKNS